MKVAIFFTCWMLLGLALDGAVINAEDGRKVYLNLSADCCSTSYFDKESIEALEGMVGHTLRRLEEVETDAPEKGCTQEDQKVHALLVTTDKASDTMLWRNDSNGYYDGYLDIEIA